MGRRASRLGNACAGAGLVLALALPSRPAAAQIATVEPDEGPEVEVVDGRDVRGTARNAQRDFERIRLRHTRVSLGGGVGRCDEHVGRFCTSYDEGEWYPRDEAEEIGQARTELLTELDSLQQLSPGDGWILGQRVWYRIDAGDGSAALAAASDCGAAEPWWCSALEGLALHELGRYEQALVEFDRALELMDAGRAREWRVPEKAVDRDARRLLQRAEDAGTDSLKAALDRLWVLADPLYLVSGNDRETEHYARWTVSEIRRDARNPYGMAWADDLEELTVRHGWELGWERVRSTLGGGRETAIGHKHPEGRDFLPSGDALRDPSAAGRDDLVTHRVEPRSLYAPAYAPIVLPMDGNVAVFVHGDRMAIVASGFLPEDTSFHARHDHPRPWLEPGDQTGMPDRMGLFAVSLDEGDEVRAQRTDGAEGTLLLDVPLGRYVVSVESWSPERRRAGRLRLGVARDRPPEDVPTLSDLLLLAPGATEPTSLEEAAPLALLRARLDRADSLAVAWELYGLGFRDETLEYAVSVERTDRNVLRRIGEFFGLADRPHPLELQWQEPAPEHPGAQFRWLALDLPTLDPGHYRITLTLRTPGRSDTQATKDFEVTEPQ